MGRLLGLMGLTQTEGEEEKPEEREQEEAAGRTKECLVSECQCLFMDDCCKCCASNEKRNDKCEPLALSWEPL